jgi:uncharacterized BrkB/YihY/UPF0761 family membrane protein
VTDDRAYPAYVTPTYPAPAPKPPVRTGDVIASVILIVVGAIVIGFVAFISLFLAMMSDGCGSGTCNYDLMGAAYYAALLLPPFVFLGAVIWAIVRMVQRRLAWWLPIVGVIAALVVWGVAYWLMAVSVGM